jgi:hypothetical protein
MTSKCGEADGTRLNVISGTKPGESRNSALWGKGGRSRTGKFAVMTVFLALVAPLGASARQAATSAGSDNSDVYISKSLLSQAQTNPNDTFRVIVQAPAGTDPTQVGQHVADFAAQANQTLMTGVKNADDRFNHSKADPHASKAAVAQAQAADNAAHAKVTDLAQTIYQQQVTDQFSSISGVSATLTGDQLANLYSQGNAGLVSITPDSPVHMSDWGPSSSGQNSWQSSSAPNWKSGQLWPYASGSANNWPMDSSSSAKWNMPSIAIVDSGIQNRSDFGNRIAASVDLSSIPNHAPGDGSGHGTFVAGIAAGEAPNYAGANPAAKLVDVKVMDSNGMGYTSDVIRACQWILDHQAQYNIGVANFSLHSDITAPFWIDPLDRAVEQLWFHGIVVVTAAGNYGSTAGASGVLYSPSDDPFVITVGAADIGTSVSTSDDKIAPW